MNNNGSRLVVLEKRLPNKKRVAWYEIIGGVIYARLENGTREIVKEVTPGYKVYDGVSPDDWDWEGE